jgi:hypothetical protein
VRARVQISNEAKYADTTYAGRLYAGTATPAVDWFGSGMAVNRTLPFSVSATISLAGLTVATFNTTAQAAFTSTLATTLSVFPNAITITSITAAAATGGRHLLQSGVVVAFSVASPTAAIATTTSTGITAATSGAGAVTFVGSLNAALAAAGAPTVTGMSVVAAPAVSGSTSGAARRSAVLLTGAAMAAVALMA